MVKRAINLGVSLSKYRLLHSDNDKTELILRFMNFGNSRESRKESVTIDDTLITRPMLQFDAPFAVFIDTQKAMCEKLMRL